MHKERERENIIKLEVYLGCVRASTHIQTLLFAISEFSIKPFDIERKMPLHALQKSKPLDWLWFGLELELLNHHDSGHFKFTSQISTAGDFQIIYLYRLLANYIKLERSSIERAFLRALFFSTKIKLCIYCWIACRSLCMPALN